MSRFTSEVISLCVASASLLEESEEAVTGKIVVGVVQCSNADLPFASSKVLMWRPASAHSVVT